VNPKDGIPIYIQLRDQLRVLILTGELEPRRKLPGARQLASYLSINRHTVSRALDDLEDEGLILKQQGRGTFVADSIQAMTERTQDLFADVVRRAVREARELGYSLEELADAVLDADEPVRRAGRDGVSIGFVECNRISLDRYCLDLKRELEVRVEPFLISELQDQVEAGEWPVGNCDLVVTTMGHLPEVRRILGDETKIFPVTGGPYLKVFFDVLALPEDYLVGIVTASETGSYGMKQAMVQAGIANDRLILGSMDKPDQIEQAVQIADALVVSNAAMSVVQPLLDNRQLPIFEYQNLLDPAGVEALRQVIQDMHTKNASRVDTGSRTQKGLSTLDLRRALNAHE
jgi:GntR family transcriptional regulator